MISRTKRLLALAVLSGLGLSGVAWAQGGPGVTGGKMYTNKQQFRLPFNLEDRERQRLPTLTSVHGALDRAGATERAIAGGDEQHVGVVGFQRQTATIGQAKMFADPEPAPGFSAIIRAPDAISQVCRPPGGAGNTKIAGADIDDPAIRRRDSERTDRGHMHLVEDRLPHDSGVRGFPNTTPGTRHEVDTRLPDHPGHR